VLHEFELDSNVKKLSRLFQQTLATTNTLKPGI
jgi:hypothetical protein